MKLNETLAARSDVWAILDSALCWSSVELERKAAENGRRMQVRQATGKVGQLGIYGVLDQRPNYWGTSTQEIGEELDRLVADASVSTILMDIDSPGGSVYGISELADKIYEARQVKPIYAVANSMAASAAYWLGSQASHLAVTPGGEVGSIGVFSMHADFSRALDTAGIKATIIRAGRFKAEGSPFEPLTDEARGAIQGRVNDYYEAFIAAVARGRQASKSDVLRNFGEGRVVGAEQARAAGMVDRIVTYEQMQARLAGREPGREFSAMADLEIAEMETI